jgi:SAM-dependent methyltransferase
MMNEIAMAHDSNRYDRLVRRKPGLPGAAPAPDNAVRLRRQFETIFAANRDALRGARVLDLVSSSGFWSLAALDAGAAYVVGVEPAIGQIESAKRAFSDYGVDAKSYRFVNSEAAAALRSFDPGAFDVVLSHGYFEQTDPRQFFSQLTRLEIKRAILDTRISVGKGPIVRLKQRSADELKGKAGGRYSTILSVPNPELITFFCDYFKFQCRLIVGKTVALSDWAGLNDYQQDQRRAYLLERLAAD